MFQFVAVHIAHQVLFIRLLKYSIAQLTYWFNEKSKYKAKTV